MPTQRQVTVRFWTSSQVRTATPATRLFMLWAMTGPRATLPGIFRLSWDDAVEDTGLTREQLEQAIAEASTLGPDGKPFLRFDPETRVLWVCKRLRYEFPNANPGARLRESIRRTLDDLPRCALVLDACKAYLDWGDPFSTLADTLSHTLSSTRVRSRAASASRSLLSAIGSPLSASRSQLPEGTTSAPIDGKRRSVPQVSLTLQGFVVPPELLARWKAAYPAVDDVELEIRHAFEWVQAHPDRHKRNWARFLVGWLKKAQDDAARGRFRRQPGQSLDARKHEILKAIEGDRSP